MLEIEIVETNVIDGGVEVFARAWRDGVQIGFGDGTIDIEKFRIFNPPVLVADPLGSVVREWQEEQEDGSFVTKSRTLREDPEEALIQTLEHNISVIAKYDDSKIMVGKRGRTTDTFYTDAAGDGTILGYQTESTPSQALWDELHDATTLGGSTAAVINTTNAYQDVAVRTRYTSASNGVQIGRPFYPFDTSALPDGDSISSATFSVYGGYVTSIPTIGVVQTSQASVATLAADDFDTSGDAINNPTEGATRQVISNSTTQYLDFALNSNGLTWISKTGYTKLGLRSDYDMDDTLPSSGTDERLGAYFADQTGTANDPKLVVEHAAAASTFVPRMMVF